MNKKFKELFSYLAIMAGALIASFSVACILLLNDAIDYGTAGIAIIISKLIGYNLSLCVLIVFLPFLAVAFGGMILGIGLSLILRNGGCIDGSEIFANIIVKHIYNRTGKDYSISYLLIGFNICVYIAVFVLLNRDAAMLSLLVYIIATAIIDHFTDHYEAIISKNRGTFSTVSTIEEILR